ncbi:MAG: nitrate reductase cytochrome c-type subunit [Wolinella sp.]
MKTLKLTLSLACAALLAVGCASSMSSSNEFTAESFRNADIFNDGAIALKDVNWSAPSAGESKLIERSFENAPPMIPHDLEGMLPVSKDMNMCITCHMPEVAEAVNATPVPKSHMYSIRFKKDLEGKLSDDRFVCTTCHVPQANIDPKFKNNFTPSFRQENGQQRSNLLDVLNDGVR